MMLLAYLGGVKPSQRGAGIVNGTKKPVRFLFAVGNGDAVDNVIRDALGEGIGTVVVNLDP